MASTSKVMRRLNGVLGLFIGIFGALAILGVFFKIAKYPNYELFMAVGFLGEAGAFIIMGFFALVNAFTGKDEEKAEVGAAVHMPEVDLSAAVQEAADEFRSELRETSAEFREGMREMLRARFAADLDAVVESVTQDIDGFGAEMRELGQEMQHARSAVHAMRGELDRVATGRLAEDAEELCTGMRQLSEGMSEAGASVERMRTDLSLMADRFYLFNHAGSARARHVSGDGVPVSAPAEARAEVKR
ncbi:MAG: hypothetical protein R3362_10085 [Rhodothermales bacterium]|nr:hypothetical protein [Rhodothermales bacterium]